MEMLGGINVARDIAEGADEDTIVKEIISQDPEVILYSQGYEKSEELLSTVMKEPEFRKTSAYREGKIYGLKAVDLSSWPSCR